jgi:hypothetical protein
MKNQRSGACAAVFHVSCTMTPKYQIGLSLTDSGSPTITCRPPNDKSSVTHYPAHGVPDAVVGKVHIVEVEVLAVAPDLCQRYVCPVVGVLVWFQEICGSRCYEVHSASAFDLRWLACPARR